MEAPADIPWATSNVTDGKWEDVKFTFEAAAKEMNIGEMVCTPQFSLHEAMSAIELMDPQMDSGMKTEAVTSLADALARGMLPLDLTSQQLIAVMDRLVACEVAWYNGNGIAQTVFTCLYLHDRSLIKDAALLAFVKLQLKTCYMVREVVVQGDIYEEEDFATHTSGFDLLAGEPDADVLREVQEVENSLASRIKALKLALKTGGPLEEVEGMYPSLAEDMEQDLAFCEALLSRLMFRRGYFSVHQHLLKPQCKGCAAAAKSIIYTQQQLSAVATTFHLQGDTPPPGFEPHCNRRMMAPTPPRVCPVLEVKDSYSQIQRYLEHVAVLTTIEQASTYPKLMQFMFDHARSAPNAVARSWWEILVMHEWMVLGNNPILEFVWSDMKDYGVTDEMRNDPEVGPFMQKVGKVIRQMFRIFGLNRARQRRKLAVSFSDWAVLQSEAAMVDSRIYQAMPQLGRYQPFMTWVLDQTLKLITVHTELGFELQLYAPPHEYRTMYWYLDHILTIRGQMCIILQEQAEARAAEAPQAAAPATGKPGKKGKEKTKGKDKKAEKKKDEKKPPKLTPVQLLLEAQRSMCRALFYGLSGLKKLGVLKDKEFIFGDLQTRYEKRFAPYARLEQPRPYSFEQYTQQSDLSKTETVQLMPVVLDVLRNAHSNAEKIIKNPDATPSIILEAKQLLKVIDENQIAFQSVCPKELGQEIEMPAEKASVAFPDNSSFLVLRWESSRE